MPHPPVHGHQAADAAEREFAASRCKSVRRLDHERESLPVSTEYVFDFVDAAGAKAAVNRLRADLRGLLRDKVVRPAVRHGVPVAAMSFSARMSPTDHLGLVKLLMCAAGRCVRLHVSDRDVQEWLLRQVTLLRPYGTACSN